MLRNVALASATALLAMTVSANAMDASDLAGRAGFLIGAARYCGVSATRASHVREWIAAKFVAAAEPQQVIYRFDGFVDAASFATSDGALPVRCETVMNAFSALEGHVDGRTSAASIVSARTSHRPAR